MRAKLRSRAPRVAKFTAGVLLLGVPSAIAATAPTTSAASAPKPARANALTAAKIPLHSAKVRFKLEHHASQAVPGHVIKVRGKVVSLKPKKGSATSAAVVSRKTTHHARVKLQARVDGHWRLVAHHRTNGTGRFAFNFKVRRAGAVRLRMLYVRNQYAPAKRAPDGHITGLTPVVASWYYDEGNTACGFHATYGVANKTLPCGTKVTINYGGRSVVATVDDRGPYVAGRDFDLDQNTADRLGMGGVATVYASRT